MSVLPRDNTKIVNIIACVSVAHVSSRDVREHYDHKQVNVVRPQAFLHTGLDQEFRLGWFQSRELHVYMIIICDA